MSDYECFCDDEPPEFYAKSEPCARKAHKCDECGKAIQAGERYEYVRGKWDGDMGFFKTCCRCKALRDHLAAHARCFCWAHGNLLDDILETVSMLPLEVVGSGLLFELGRLAVAIKRAPLTLTPADRALADDIASVRKPLEMKHD